MKKGTVRIRPLGPREIDQITGVNFFYQVNTKLSFLISVPNSMVIDYVKEALLLPNGGIIADPTGTIVSYEGGYALLALLQKAEDVIAKKSMDEFLKMQYVDGSWEQQYYPLKRAGDRYDPYVRTGEPYTDIQVDSGAAMLAWAMAEYDRAHSTTIYQTDVAKAFDFLRAAQVQHYNAHGTGLLANQRWNYVAGNPIWDTTALGADCAEVLLSALKALEAYGAAFTNDSGYSVRSLANDIYTSICQYLTSAVDYTDPDGTDEFYFWTSYPLQVVALGMPKGIQPQGISYTQALISEAIYKWAKSAFLIGGTPDYSYLCKRALNFAIVLTRGKWGGFYYHPIGKIWGKGIRGNDVGLYDEFPAFTAHMVRAMDAVDSTFYEKDIDLGISFLRTCTLKDGRVYNRVKIDGTLDLGEADVEGSGMHFRCLNAVLAILAGA